MDDFLTGMHVLSPQPGWWEVNGLGILVGIGVLAAICTALWFRARPRRGRG